MGIGSQIIGENANGSGKLLKKFSRRESAGQKRCLRWVELAGRLIRGMQSVLRLNQLAFGPKEIGCV